MYSKAPSINLPNFVDFVVTAKTVNDIAYHAAATKIIPDYHVSVYGT